MASDQVEYCGDCPKMRECANEIKSGKFKGCKAESGVIS